MSKTNSTEGKRAERPSRRAALKAMLGLPVLGGISASLMTEESILLAEEEAKNTEKALSTDVSKADATSGATRTSWELPKIAELAEPIPHAKLGTLDVSRLILGGNLIGGWAHSRDLIYVSELIKRYHTKEKVFQTFQVAEKCGINTFMGNPVMNEMMEEYWRWTDGRMQFISDCGGQNHDMRENVRAAIDFGCDGCYLHGGITDKMVQEGNFKLLEDCLRIIRDAGLPAGFGAHYQATVDGIAAAGLVPDFWMKTFHSTSYWSARPGEPEHDNIFCREPEETSRFMEGSETPWIAFKVLAAGALAPNVGFRAALEAGADFLCVGMYDFQIVDDVNLITRILKDIPNRKRRMIPAT